MPKLCKFKLNPSVNNPFELEKKYYYHISVFSNQSELFLEANKLSKQDENHNYGAVVIPYYSYRLEVDSEKDEIRSICKPKIGDALFTKEYLDAEIIAHEAVHLSTNYLRLLKKLNLGEEIDDNEELFAYCVGGITQELIKNFYKHGVFS